MVKFMWSIAAGLTGGFLVGLMWWNYVYPMFIRFFH